MRPNVSSTPSIVPQPQVVGGNTEDQDSKFRKAKNFDELYSMVRLTPVINKIKKSIQKLDDYCQLILSIVEGSAEPVPMNTISAIIDGISRRSLQTHINRHLSKGKDKGKNLINISREGKSYYYSSNIKGYIRSKLEEFGIHVNNLSESELDNIYYEVISVLDLSLAY